MKVEKISSGSFDLNKWLHGGYEKGVITMIAGPPASGKTNMVLLAACSQAKKGNKVIFIDTEGGFSPERVEQIIGEGEEEEKAAHHGGSQGVTDHYFVSSYCWTGHFVQFFGSLGVST